MQWRSSFRIRRCRSKPVPLSLKPGRREGTERLRYRPRSVEPPPSPPPPAVLHSPSEADNSIVPRPVERKLRVFSFDPLLGTKLDMLEIHQLTVELPWDVRDGEASGPGPSASTSRWSTATRRAAASTSRSTSITRTCSPRTACPLGGQPAVPPADGLRGRDDHDPPLRAGPGPGGAVDAPTSRRDRHGNGRQVASGRSTSSGCASTRTPCARPTPTTTPTRRPCCSATSRAQGSHGGENLPGGTVFTCLSHDIVAHETTHALLDGMHRYFVEPSNPDVLAFHEAFADIVALFQHFSLPEVLRHQIGEDPGRPDARAEPAGRAGPAVRRGDRQRGALRQ